MTPAHLCALVSEMVYAPLDDWTARADALGLDVIAKYDTGGTQAVLLTDGQLAINAYRGTDDLRALLTDLRYIKCDFPGGGRVHRGFFSAFNQVRDAVERDIEKTGLPMVYTGHSLGAAPAIMSAVLWGAEQVHVYGCPRVGNKDFVKRLDCPAFRYENRLDFVTSVPLWTSPVQAVHAWKNGRKPTLYKHAGVKVALSGWGHPVNRYVKATRGLQLPVVAAAREVA